MPPDYRKVFWLVDAMSKAFLQRMEKREAGGKGIDPGVRRLC